MCAGMWVRQPPIQRELCEAPRAFGHTYIHTSVHFGLPSYRCGRRFVKHLDVSYKHTHMHIMVFFSYRYGGCFVKPPIQRGLFTEIHTHILIFSFRQIWDIFMKLPTQRHLHKNHWHFDTMGALMEFVHIHTRISVFFLTDMWVFHKAPRGFVKSPLYSCSNTMLLQCVLR